MGTLLIRRRRPIDEPPTAPRPAPRAAPGPAPADDAARLTLPAGATTRAGIGGAGRIVQSLAELGHVLDPVQQLVVDADAPPSRIDAIDLGERFAIVVLGSHLVNVPEAETRRALLAAARRHLAPGATLLVEHHPLDWAETAAAVQPTPGSSVGMVNVRRDPPFVSATSVYDAGGRWFERPFRARVLSDAELASALAACGLAVRRRVGPTWIESTLI